MPVETGGFTPEGAAGFVGRSQSVQETMPDLTPPVTSAREALSPSVDTSPQAPIIVMLELTAPVIVRPETSARVETPTIQALPRSADIVDFAPKNITAFPRQLPKAA